MGVPVSFFTPWLERPPIPPRPVHRSGESHCCAAGSSRRLSVCDGQTGRRVAPSERFAHPAKVARANALSAGDGRPSRPGPQRSRHAARESDDPAPRRRCTAPASANSGGRSLVTHCTIYNRGHTKKGDIMKRKSVVLFVIILSIVASAAYARGKSAAPTAPGAYKGWGQDIDQIEVLKTFKIADSDKIAIQPFDHSATPL